MLYTEAEFRKAYIVYLIMLYELESESGIDLGEYPSAEQFRFIYEQERNASLH